VWQQHANYLERVTFPQYSPWGNLRQQQVIAAPPNSYLWGYEETQLLAEVRNATYAQIAYTSFEPDAAGRFVYDSGTGSGSHLVPGGRTGRWAYRLDSSGDVGRDSLIAGEYELLVWAQSAVPPVLNTSATIRQQEEIQAAPGGWHQFRWHLRFAAPGSISLHASAASTPMVIDEVRLHPVGAQMTSYTYDPLVGMTSQTDATGRTTTYEYDGLGRLLRARDEQDRIRTQNEYHYARP